MEVATHGVSGFGSQSPNLNELQYSKDDVINFTMTANLSPDSPSSLIYIDDSPTPEVTSAKERMAYDLVDSTIPARNNLRGLPALVVLLGDIFKDANKRREITRLIDARSVSVIAGNGHYFPKYVLRSQAKRDIYDNSGVS